MSASRGVGTTPPCSILAATLLLASLPGAPQAAGFALIEQSVSGLGSAYAGAAAEADGVDTLFFNPAGMTRLPGTQGGVALHIVVPQAEFKDEGTTFSPPLGGAIPGGDGGDAGVVAAVPNLYLSHQLSDSLWAGLAVNVPFGLTTDYDADWVGRYHALRSAVETVHIHPSLAYRVDERLSIAAGVSAMYFKGEFTTAMDFGLIDGGPGSQGTADGKSVIEGDSWGWGFNLGALLELSDATRIGVHYRSEVAQKIEGTVDWRGVPAGQQAVFEDGPANADIDLPASFSVSAFHRLSDQWAILGDYSWTGWSSIPELRFRLDGGTVPDGVTTFRWKDTSRLALGGLYTPAASDWHYRLGIAYDESPVRDAASRSPRLPDADRLWVTVGAGFSAGRDLTINIGYAHLFFDDPEIRKTGLEPEDATRGALNGGYETSIDVLSVEARYLF
jgi:long-chain fatty acid transport protein